ncbi:hypothetical protein GCM10011608_51890 [Micromonospora sonchi]|uniref:Nucleotidyltransferase family protein n=1 Tax=Micromonospora sonchi TaxID=1763543 RepID=A0A917X3D5_9ACTN|nr:nucleotidyltransferase family protein [Micromonospora sonchi]GGM60475.1 hypothetical protein GCM10011608_51890 [Micromonospora sonchi]
MTALADAVRCLALDSAAAATCALLRAHGIDAVLLKGAGLARLLGVERRYIDVDLLVAPAAFEAAQQALATAGYRPVVAGARPDEQLFHERQWFVPGSVSLVVDLHRGFGGVDDPEGFWQAMRSGAGELPLADGWVLVPDRICAALLTVLHAARPGKADHAVTDLSRALDMFTIDDWRAAAAVARRCAAEEAFALGLRTTERGRLLAADLGGLPVVYTPSRWLAAHRSCATAKSLARLTEQPTARARLRHFRLRLLPSPASMRFFSPLARRGRLGLLLAYAGRLGWHAARLPRGVRELRAARHADDGSASDPPRR